MKVLLGNLLAAARTKYSNETHLYQDFGPLKLLGPNFIRLDPPAIKYLYKLAQTSKVGIVEVGRERGGSTLVLAAANTDNTITSVDVDSQHDDKLLSWFKHLDIGLNVNMICENCSTVDINHDYDLLWWDVGFPGVGEVNEEEIESFVRDCLIGLHRLYDLLAPDGSILFNSCNSPLNKYMFEVFLKNKNVECIIDIHQADYYSPTATLGHYLKRD